MAGSGQPITLTISCPGKMGERLMKTTRSIHFSAVFCLCLSLVLIPLSSLGVDGDEPVSVQSDKETLRYQGELQTLRIEGSMYDIQSRAFAVAAPDMRAKMWNDLEILKKELATDEFQELLAIRAQNEATPDYDTETLGYKSALEKAGKSEEEVKGLVTLFSNGNELMRKTLMDGLAAQ
jgi:hypothetical protein